MSETTKPCRAEKSLLPLDEAGGHDPRARPSRRARSGRSGRPGRRCHFRCRGRSSRRAARCCRALPSSHMWPCMSKSAGSSDPAAGIDDRRGLPGGRAGLVDRRDPAAVDVRRPATGPSRAVLGIEDARRCGSGSGRAGDGSAGRRGCAADDVSASTWRRSSGRGRDSQPDSMIWSQPGKIEAKKAISGPRVAQQ